MIAIFIFIIKSRWHVDNYPLVNLVEYLKFRGYAWPPILLKKENIMFGKNSIRNKNEYLR